jgi:hypothetical protein
LSLKPGGTAFSQTHLYVPGLAESTFPVYGNLLDLAQSVGLYKAERLGDGMQLRRAFAADLTYSQMLEFLLSYYNALAGPDSYELSNTLDQLAQFDEQSEQAAGCVVVFHESRELDGEAFSSTPDQRGPQGGTHPDFRESDVSESTPISGLSRSNAPDQTPKFKEDLPLKKFILHVYLFDVFRQAIKPGIRNTPFARNSPALRLQVPQLPLMSAVIQADAKN